MLLLLWWSSNSLVQEKPTTRTPYLRKTRKVAMPPMFLRFKSEKVKTFGSNTGKSFYWLVGLKINFQNANQCRLIPMELLWKLPWNSETTAAQKLSSVFFPYIISKNLMFSGMTFLWIRSKRQSQHYLFRARNDLSRHQRQRGFTLFLKQQQTTWYLSLFYLVVSYTRGKNVHNLNTFKPSRRVGEKSSKY